MIKIIKTNKYACPRMVMVIGNGFFLNLFIEVSFEMIMSLKYIHVSLCLKYCNYIQHSEISVLLSLVLFNHQEISKTQLTG